MLVPMPIMLPVVTDPAALANTILTGAAVMSAAVLILSAVLFAWMPEGDES